jgi:radical SAM superfamily enzyme YgiQ (UPF0313 family)
VNTPYVTSLTFIPGVSYISAILKKNGHQVNLFWVRKPEDINELILKIKDWNPDVIGFSVLAFNFESIRKIIHQIQPFCKNKLIVCGGVQAILMPELFFKRIKRVDAVCIGEGEYSFLELINKYIAKKKYWETEGFWVKKRGKIFKNLLVKNLVNLDTLPLSDRDLFLGQTDFFFDGSKVGTEGNVIEILLNRGCPFNCSFCSNNALKKVFKLGYVRFLSVDRAIEELVTIIKKYKVDFFFFHDDIFTIRKDWLFKFLSIYKRKINKPFYCHIRVDICDEKILKKLKEGGCFNVAFGLESGNSYIRNDVIKKNINTSQIKKIVNIAKKLKLKTTSYNMIGLPFESKKEFIETVKLNAKLNVDYPILQIYYPIPGTDLYRLCKKHSFLKKENKNIKLNEQSVLNLPTFPAKEITYYFKNWDRLIFYARNKDGVLKNFLSKAIFTILAVPPTSNLFKIYHGLFKITDSIYYFRHSL